MNQPQTLTENDVARLNEDLLEEIELMAMYESDCCDVLACVARTGEIPPTPADELDPEEFVPQAMLAQACEIHGNERLTYAAVCTLSGYKYAMARILDLLNGEQSSELFPFLPEMCNLAMNNNDNDNPTNEEK